MNLPATPTVAAVYPRSLRALALFTAIATYLLVGVGSIVTTFRAGMADKIWPTAPWHLLIIEWEEPQPGFLIEHAHRIAGYLVGFGILALVGWLQLTAPSRIHRWLGTTLVLVLAGSVATGLRWVRQLPRSVEALQQPIFLVAAGTVAALLILALVDLRSRSSGRWTRTLAVLTYIGVLVQGMLGGLRVYLNELIGPNLAVIHGVFAEFVFCFTVLLAIMMTRRWNDLLDLASEPIDVVSRRVTQALVSVLLVQVIFGSFLRHQQLPLAQRLHPFLAFVVVILASILLARCYMFDAGKSRRIAIWHLVGLIAVQAFLGIESWLATINAGSSLHVVGLVEVTVRTAHLMIGFGIFTSAVTIMARDWRAWLL
jgi:heme A synthase